MALLAELYLLMRKSLQILSGKRDFFIKKITPSKSHGSLKEKKQHGYWAVKGMIKVRNAMKAEDQKILI